jgi:hypothetical protein
MRIKIRRRAEPPKAWKWEIFDDSKSKTVTGSHLAYGNREDAYEAAQLVLSNVVTQQSGSD